MLTPQQIEFFQSEFEKALNLEDQVRADFVVSEQQGDDIDISNRERERSLEIKLNWRQSLYLKKVKKALEKIDNKTFGLCEDCDKSISVARLKARPVATLCVTCKEEQEKKENHIPYQKKSSTLGKGFSVKQSVPGGTDQVGMNLAANAAE